jgi:hypothetical protein
MTTKRYVSIAAGNFLQPIADLVAKLIAQHRDSMAEVKANEQEGDYAISTILLTVAMFESWLMRIQYDRGERTDGGFSYYEKLRGKHDWPDLKEVFVLRNTLAHNHVWEVWYDDSNPQAWVLDHIEHLIGCKTKNFKETVDLRLGRTKAHHLHIVPSLVDRTDASAVLILITAAAGALEKAGLLFGGMLHHVAVLTNGTRVDLHGLSNMLRDNVVKKKAAK